MHSNLLDVMYENLERQEEIVRRAREDGDLAILQYAQIKRDAHERSIAEYLHAKRGL